MTVRQRLELAAWMGFVAWCVSGFPPCVDLPAHAAQMQTLVEVLRGAPEVAGTYRATFPIGYGLSTWLAVPLAWLVDGAFAARAFTWLAIVLFPLAHRWLRRALGLRPATWSDLAAAAFAFNISYWYGFVPTLWALTATLACWAALLRALHARRMGAGRLFGVAALGATVLLSHLVMFGPLVVGALALSWRVPFRRRALVLASAVAPALLVGLARIVELLGRTQTGGALAWDWELPGHLNWLFKASTPLGQLDVTVCWAMGLLCVVAWLRQRVVTPAVWLTLSLLALYLATPKAMAGAWLLFPRLTALVSVAALLLVDLDERGWWARGVAGLAVASLLISAERHRVFAREVNGLAEVTARPPPKGGIHGGLSLVGPRTDSLRQPVVEHLPQWWTARHGGLGHHFFADADHQPVRFVEGHELPQHLEPDADFSGFSGLLVFGEGPLPEALQGFTVTLEAGRWRRLERR